MLEHKYKLWIIGYGDIGQRLARLYDQHGIEINVTYRNPAILKEADTQRRKSAMLDLDTNECHIEPSSEEASLFYFIPPPRQGCLDNRLQKFIRLEAIQAKKIVLISTTGVYGDCKGDWVDETRKINPVHDRALRRADAEQQLIDWAKKNEADYIILRVPGIYANNRLPVKRLQQRLPIVRESESPWTNRIHADDLATICFKAMHKLMSGEVSNEIINVSDGNPSTMTQYFNTVADYLGLQRPPQISLQQAETDLSKGMMSYMNESRRILNKKMLEQLQIKLLYPNLTEGLKKNT